MELSDAKSKILSLEALNAGMDSTYQETIGKLQEDYENEIYKLKQTLEEVRKTQVEQLERTFGERQEAENQIALENFEKELAKLRQQHEELINDIKKECEEDKQTSLGEMKAQHDKKLIELEEGFGKEKTEMELRMNDIRHRTGKESNWFKVITFN